VGLVAGNVGAVNSENMTTDSRWVRLNDVVDSMQQGRKLAADEILTEVSPFAMA
jgi:hypothetical protein